MSSKAAPFKVQESQGEKDRKAKEKAERKAEFEAKRLADLASKSNQGSTGGKSKADLRKERKAIQEEQRAAKESEKKPAKSTDSVVKLAVAPKSSAKSAPPQPILQQVDKSPTPGKEASPVKDVTKNFDKLTLTIKSEVRTSPARDQLPYAQIPMRCEDIDDHIKGLGHNGHKVHPSFIRLGLKMNRDVIRGTEPRCVALLLAIKDVVVDYVTPSSKELTRDLHSKLKVYMKFLNECRPNSVGMMAAFEHISLQIPKIPMEKLDTEKKRIIIDAIDEYIYNEVALALQAITQFGRDIIKAEGDCIVTMGASLKVQHILYSAYRVGKKFKVIVVDAGPEYRGIELVEFLTKLDISVSYVYINAVPYILPEATKVMVGAYAVLANGHVMAKTGSSQLALLAGIHNVPVYVCCETSEFADAVYTDAFRFNEIRPQKGYFAGKASKLQKYIEDNQGDAKRGNLSAVDLLYDVTPPDFVSIVITEKGVFPALSVQAVMRRQFTQKS